VAIPAADPPDNSSTPGRTTSLRRQSWGRGWGRDPVRAVVADVV